MRLKSIRRIEKRLETIERLLDRLLSSVQSSPTAKAKGVFITKPACALPAQWPSEWGQVDPEVSGASRVSAWMKGVQAGAEGKPLRDCPYDFNSRGHKQAWERGWMRGAEVRAGKSFAA